MFLYHLWLELPINTRIEIASKFDIPKTRPTHVADNKITDDGYDIKAIEKAINTEQIKKFLNSDNNDAIALWVEFIDVINGKTTLVTPVIKFDEEVKKREDKVEIKPEEVKIKKLRGRPKKTQV